MNLSPRHRRIGMVFQDLALWPHLSAFENVAFPLRVTRRRDAEGAVPFNDVTQLDFTWDEISATSKDILATFTERYLEGQ